MDQYLEDALALAARGAGRISPNPAVGAVVVRNGEVVGRGFHTWAGVKHAEVLALEQAGGAAQGCDALRDAGAVLAPWPHASVHRRDSGGGHSQSGRAACWRIPTRTFPAAASAGCATPAWKWNSTRARGTSGRDQSGVSPFHAHRPALGDAESGADAGRQNRGAGGRIRAGPRHGMDHQ